MSIFSHGARRRGARLLLAVMSVLATPSIASTAAAELLYNISTVAGAGRPGSSGDGRLATLGRLWNPTGVAVDADGRIYIADYKNRKIRTVSTDGVLSTFAGTGEPPRGAEIGDGGPAAEAPIANAYGVAVDAEGNVYIADQRGARVRRVTTDGVISTFAGNGITGYSGDGGPAVEARLRGPNAIAFDSKGNVYIADTGNNRIRRVSPEGIISTWVGTGEQPFAGDGGPATEANIANPSALFVDEADNVYVCDFGNHCVRRVTPEGVISTIAGTGEEGFNGDDIPATEAQMNEPCGVAVDRAGNVFIADSVNNRIRVVLPTGVIQTIAGTGVRGYSGDGGPATAAQIRIPDQIDLDAAGNIYVAEYGSNVIRKLTPRDD